MGAVSEKTGSAFDLTTRLLIPKDRVYRPDTPILTGGVPVPADRLASLFPRYVNFDEIRAKLPASPASGSAGSAPDPVKNPTSTDGVMQALLQQLEYSKQAPAAGGSSGVNRVQVLPGGGGSAGGSTGLVVLLALIGVGVVLWLVFKGKKGKRGSGVTHVSDD